MKTLAALLAAGGLLLGLLAGYFLWGYRGQDLERELRAAQSREATEKQRADGLEAKAAQLQAEAKRLTDDVSAERELRHKYERLVGQGRK